MDEDFSMHLACNPAITAEQQRLLAVSSSKGVLGILVENPGFNDHEAHADFVRSLIDGDINMGLKEILLVRLASRREVGPAAQAGLLRVGLNNVDSFRGSWVIASVLARTCANLTRASLDTLRGTRNQFVGESFRSNPHHRGDDAPALLDLPEFVAASDSHGKNRGTASVIIR